MREDHREIGGGDVSIEGSTHSMDRGIPVLLDETYNRRGRSEGIAHYLIAIVAKGIQKRVRMGIRRSDERPYIPFSTDYVILLRTVLLLCITVHDCALLCITVQ